jgi:predicted nucleic acid-binding protein
MSEFFGHPIVCNTGPIIALSRAGMGHLLGALFTRVLLPEPVVAELRARHAGDAADTERAIALAQIVRLDQPPDPLLLAELDHGEAAVIQVAREHGIKGVLIDERRARRVAHTIYGLSVKGTCALLVEGKRRRLIIQVRPALEAMLAGGYFIGPQLKAECLRQAGE